MEGWLSGQGGFVLYAAFFLAVAGAEAWRGGGGDVALADRRGLGNLSLFLLSAVILALPVLAGLTAAVAGEGGGLLAWLDLPDALRVIVALIALDAFAYGQHRLSHALPALWRFHAVHHSDPAVDVTTQLRHHPIEAVIDAVLSGGFVLLLGAHVGDVALYALLARIVQTLAHANLAMPAWVRGTIGQVVVTPGFHRLHHSARVAETDSNYGMILTVWDRLLGTARARPGDADPDAFGLGVFDEAAAQAPLRLLAQPFLTQGGSDDPARTAFQRNRASPRLPTRSAPPGSR